MLDVIWNTFGRSTSGVKAKWMENGETAELTRNAAVDKREAFSFHFDCDFRFHWLINELAIVLILLIT